MRWAEDNDSPIPAGSIFLLEGRKTEEKDRSGKKERRPRGWTTGVEEKKDETQSPSVCFLSLCQPAISPVHWSDQFAHVRQWQRRFSETHAGARLHSRPPQQPTNVEMTLDWNATCALCHGIIPNLCSCGNVLLLTMLRSPLQQIISVLVGTPDNPACC